MQEFLLSNYTHIPDNTIPMISFKEQINNKEILMYLIIILIENKQIICYDIILLVFFFPNLVSTYVTPYE